MTAARVRTAEAAAMLASRGSWLNHNLLTDGDDPFVLKQLRCRGSLQRIALEAPAEEVKAQVAELIMRRQ